MIPVPAEPGRPVRIESVERPVGRVRGTRDWLPGDFARVAALERLLLDQFRRAGYEPMRTPILEFAELHERKSGAGIVARLFEITGGGPAEICLRPELTASIVRAYAEAAECPPCPLASACRARSSGFSRPRPGVTASSPRSASS